MYEYEVSAEYLNLPFIPKHRHTEKQQTNRMMGRQTNRQTYREGENEIERDREIRRVT